MILSHIIITITTTSTTIAVITSSDSHNNSSDSDSGDIIIKVRDNVKYDNNNDKENNYEHIKFEI